MRRAWVTLRALLECRGRATGRPRLCSSLLSASLLLAAGHAAARELAYVTNSADGTLWIIDPGDASLRAEVAFGNSLGPVGVAITPQGERAFITNIFSDT